MKKVLSLLIVLIAVLQHSLPLLADDLSFQSGNLTVVWSEANQSFTLRGILPDGSSKSIVTRSKPKATYVNASGTDRGYFTTDRYASVDYVAEPVSDAFGEGTAHRFTFTNPTAAAEDGVVMEETFFAYADQPFVLVQLALISTSGSPISSHHLEPVSCESATWRFLSTTAADNRMLKVPFDNDGFGRYHTYRLNRAMTSYEVSCLFDGAARYGAVYGSVDHDHWKSGICVEATGGTSVSKLQLISGMADGETRDHLSGYDRQSHGSLIGDTVKSARFLVGLFADWREGMECFAEACATIRPARSDWQHGTPFGWQSWGVLAEKNSYKTDLEISDYYAQVLQPAGFCSADGSIVFSLDASDNISTSQRKELVKNGEATHQLIGSYSTPFALWWDEASINNITATWTVDGQQVTRPYAETLIKINGKPVKYDGAYCRDPSHPVTKQDIVNYVRSRANEGVKWIKADFLNCGIIQSDSYYKKDITTAVEAYNDGMRYLQQQCERYGIFLDLSIAPLFPHGHANGRRIACDTWGRIDQTEYAMNAISGGWWTDRLYQYNDPDHLVLIGRGDQLGSSLGENRARVTSGAVTGMMLVADNFSPSDQSGRGNNAMSRQRASSVLTNTDVNAVARLGRSFRPLYGHKEYDLNDDHAQSLFVHEADSFVYVAAFNYTAKSTTYIIPLADLGLSEGEELAESKELWTGEPVSVGIRQFSIAVPAKDVRLVRLRLAHPHVDAVHAPHQEAAVLSTQDFDLLGRQLPSDSYHRPLDKLGSRPLDKLGSRRLVLRRTLYADGSVRTQKILLP